MNISKSALMCKNLDTYVNIMNEVMITNKGRAWICFIFTMLVVKNKPIMLFAILKYWVFRTIYGIKRFDV